MNTFVVVTLRANNGFLERLPLRPKAQLAIDHRRTKRAFCRIVGRIDPCHFQKNPQVIFARRDLIAEPDQLHIAAEAAVQQQVFECRVSNEPNTIEVVCRQGTSWLGHSSE